MEVAEISEVRHRIVASCVEEDALLQKDDEKRNDISTMAHNAAEQMEEFVCKMSHNAAEQMHHAAEQIHHAAEQVHHAAEHVEEFVCKVWNNCHFHALPQWLQDNEYLHTGHRPPLNSFIACFKSIFRVHTETVNIWTHFLGCIAFMGVATYFLYNPSVPLDMSGKVVFMLYFMGTIICLGLSSAFHTMHCHSEVVGKLFSKLDYCGIAVLITVSFVPWLYYGFYCHLVSKIVYTSVVVLLGCGSISVSFWDKFSEPNLRPFRASVFATFGLSGIIPAIHYVYAEGLFNKIAMATLGWLILVGTLYLIGAAIYALRIPECYFPGKCDILFQSHQIFHVFVIIAAFVHYHGITEMAVYRMSMTDCGGETLI